MNITTLREANNSVHICGILKNTDLEIRQDKNGNNFISGKVIVLVEGDDDIPNEVTIRCQANQYTATKQESKSYNNLVKFRANCVTMASLMAVEGLPEKEAKKRASYVRINGRLMRSEYPDKNGKLASYEGISCNFITIFDDNNMWQYAPEATFDVEIFFKALRPEMNRDGEETGRLLIDGIIPIYGGKVIPYSFVAEEDAADYMSSNYEAGRTGHVWGDLISTVQRQEIIHQGFGKPRKEVKTTFKHENLITSGDEKQYDEDDEKSFNIEAIKTAWKIRETETIPAILNRGNNNTNGANNNSNTGFNSTKRSGPKFDF